jgi:DNA-binding response OmpR family regulator
MDGERVLEREHVDLVLLDWGAAGAPGDKAVEGVRIASSGAPPPVIALLTGNDPAAATAARRAGCHGFMFRPFSPHELLLRTRRILQWDDQLIPMGQEDLWDLQFEPEDG